MSTRAAIETTYAGARFRSRLESRWACFFDLLGWRWEYEPIELNGYIPDFILLLHSPILVEVKPGWTCDELERLAAEKIDAAGWVDEALIVGASWSTMETPDWPRNPRVGSHIEAEVCGHTMTRAWNPMAWMECGSCHRTSLMSEVQSFRCRREGCYDGDSHIGPARGDRLARLWNEAGSTVQWRAK